MRAVTGALIVDGNAPILSIRVCGASEKVPAGVGLNAKAESGRCPARRPDQVEEKEPSLLRRVMRQIGLRTTCPRCFTALGGEPLNRASAALERLSDPLGRALIVAPCVAHVGDDEA